MSTDTIRNIVGGESPLVSWETWDQIKHTEGFVLVAAAVFAGLLSWLLRNVPFVNGYHSLAGTILCFAMFALGFNLLLGQTGLLSFGHAMFWGGSAYAAMIFADYFAGYPLVMILVGTLFAFLLAFFSAFILLRLHSVYFAIVTLAIAQVLYFLAREPLREYTGGFNGLSVPREGVLGTISLNALLAEPLRTLWRDHMYLLVVVAFVGVVVFITRIRKSPYGLLFKAIRENETRASFVGVDVWRYKFAAFVLSASIAGFAGAIYAVDTQFVGVSRLYWEVSGNIVVMAVLGGLGTLAGPVLGSMIFLYFARVVNQWGFSLPVLGSISQYWLLMLAISFTAVVWKSPDGLWGLITDFTKALRDPKGLARKIKRLPRGAIERIGGGDR